MMVSVDKKMLIELFQKTDDILCELVRSQSYLYFIDHNYGEDFQTYMIWLRNIIELFESHSERMLGKDGCFERHAMSTLKDALDDEKESIERMITELQERKQMRQSCSDEYDKWIKQDTEQLQDLNTAIAVIMKSEEIDKE